MKLELRVTRQILVILSVTNSAKNCLANVMATRLYSDLVLRL